MDRSPSPDCYSAYTLLPRLSGFRRFKHDVGFDLGEELWALLEQMILLAFRAAITNDVVLFVYLDLFDQASEILIALR